MNEKKHIGESEGSKRERERERDGQLCANHQEEKKSK